MEAKPASESRKRPSSSLSRASGDSNGAPINPNFRRPESPSKRPRPRASDLLMHDLVKDLRSHRVFSPSSELYGDMASQKLGFGLGCAESEDSKAGSEGLEGFDNGVGVLGEKCSEAKVVLDSDSKAKSFIRPCFRRKVFKNPASLSYRRLLPYLMDISKKNTGELEIVRSKADKGLEGNKLQAVESSLSDESSKLGIDNDKDRLSAECQNDHSNTLQKTLLDCANESAKRDKLKSTSSDTGALSSSTTRADECCSSPLVSVGIQESYVELSCQDQLLNNLEVAAEDLMVVKESIVHTSSNVNKSIDSAGSEETHNGILCTVQDGDIAKTNLSSTASDSHLHKDVDQCHYSEDTKLAKYDGVTEPVIVHPFECKEQYGMKHRKCGNVGEVVINQVNDLNEVSNQMTPPDAEIFDSFLVEGNEEDRPDYSLHNRDHLHGNQSNKVNQGNASLDYNTRHEFNSKCRGVLKPRSQAKLFKSPGSFSYRRMLPFIMDIAKDNCDAPSNGQVKMLEKDSKESYLLTHNNQEISSDKSHSLVFEEQEDDSAALPVVLPMPVKNPSNDKENLISGSEFQMTINSHKEDLSIVKEVASVPSELGRSTDLLTPVQPVRDKGPQALLLCPTNTEASIEELAISRAGVRSDCVYSSDTDKFQVTQSQRDYLGSSRNSADGLKRGILKRNPRGCRGLCTCLNCTSFRLHAERAFEFSRNQMEDTEELVLELVTELSHLRSVLEKSADADDHHAIHINQVKEACSKASQVEEFAKDHLSHMNYELGVHCRITCLERPRVKFSDYVQEHFVSKPKADFPVSRQRTAEALEGGYTKSIE